MFTPIAYSHDSTREELIARFRDRIAAGERTKLTKQERAELALHFVDRLARCKTEEEAIALCQAEIALLEEGYPVASVANQYLPEWRKAIALAVAEGRLPKQELEPNEFGKRYEHWGLKYLLYPNAVHRALKAKTTAANNVKQDDLQPIRADRFVETARELLAGDTPYEWAVGLLAVTGRRFSEIVAKGVFKPTNHPFAIAFRGQLKKGIQNREEAPTFLIASLIESEQVLAVLERFRAHPRIQELAHLSPDEINSRLNSSVRHYIQQAFEATGIVPILTGEKRVSAHNLRGCYAEIAVHFFCPPHQGTHRFVQAHLGHLIGERELASRKNAGATEHYFHYRLIGERGQPVHEKGILLDRFGPLPTTGELELGELESEQPVIEAGIEEVVQPVIQKAVVEESLESVPMAIAPLSKSKSRSRQSRAQNQTAEQTEEQTMAIAPLPKSKAQTAERTEAHRTAIASQAKSKARTHVPVELMHDLKAVAAQKLDADGSYAEILEAVIDFLRDDKTPTIATSIESFGATFQWFVGEVERLREEIRRLAAERDLAIAKLEELQEQPHDQGELDALKAENARLKAEVERFHQIKQLLGGDAAEATGASAPRAAVVSPEPLQSTQHAHQRRLGDQGQALEKINQAIDLIMAWNDDPMRDFNHKWFISVPVILSLIRGSGFSASQGRVQTAMAHRKADIDAHHRKHGLGQRHNTRHHQPITEDITL